jgi:hypothetical protein
LAAELVHLEKLLSDLKTDEDSESNLTRADGSRQIIATFDFGYCKTW